MRLNEECYDIYCPVCHHMMVLMLDKKYRCPNTDCIEFDLDKKVLHYHLFNDCVIFTARWRSPKSK